MINIWCVRADYGTYTNHFVNGGYVAIGWAPETDLKGVNGRDQLYPIYQKEHPEDTSNLVIGQQVGQIARFILEIKENDYVITPAADTEYLHFGRIKNLPNYQYSEGLDGCPYRHRRLVQWDNKALKRSMFSVPFQNSIRSSLTVFGISQREEFLSSIGQTNLMPIKEKIVYDSYQVVLNQILELDAKEFEFLVSHLLTALGFEGSEVTGKTGDGGVDAKGELNASNLAKVKVFVQAKRYKLGMKIASSVVRQLRQAIPFGGQGAFITTADFQKSATEVALEPGFPRIGLVNGTQLVDLLIEHWEKIPMEFREKLGLKPGLVKL